MKAQYRKHQPTGLQTTDQTLHPTTVCALSHVPIISGTGVSLGIAEVDANKGRLTCNTQNLWVSQTVANLTPRALQAMISDWAKANCKDNLWVLLTEEVYNELHPGQLTQIEQAALKQAYVEKVVNQPKAHKVAEKKPAGKKTHKPEKQNKGRGQ